MVRCLATVLAVLALTGAGCIHIYLGPQPCVEREPDNPTPRAPPLMISR